jgi:hypothetical protein
MKINREGIQGERPGGSAPWAWRTDLPSRLCGAGLAKNPHLRRMSLIKNSGSFIIPK